MSFYGFIDPIQTPEAGSDVGRYLSPNIYTYVTTCHGTDDIIQFLSSNPYVLTTPTENCLSIKINYNIRFFTHYSNMIPLYN